MDAAHRPRMAAWLFSIVVCVCAWWFAMRSRIASETRYTLLEPASPSANHTKVTGPNASQAWALLSDTEVYAGHLTVYDRVYRSPVGERVSFDVMAQSGTSTFQNVVVFLVISSGPDIEFAMTREFVAGSGTYLFGLVTTDVQLGETVDHAAARALEQSADVVASELVALLPDGHPGLIETKWSRQRFIPFLATGCKSTRLHPPWNKRASLYRFSVTKAMLHLRGGELLLPAAASIRLAVQLLFMNATALPEAGCDLSLVATDAHQADEPWAFAGERQVYRRYFAIYERHFRAPTGHQLRVDVVGHPSLEAALFVVICPVFGLNFTKPRFALVHEFAAGSGGYHFGFPAGGVDIGETPLEAAARELAEEAKLVATEWVPLLMGPLLEVSNARNRFLPFLALGCTEIANVTFAGHQAEAEEVGISVHWMDESQVWAQLQAGQLFLPSVVTLELANEWLRDHQPNR